jgi:hypothetical protein
MEAIVGLVGVAVGALIAPLLELLHRRTSSRESRRKELLELVASYLARSGDQLVVEPEADLDARWRSEVGLEANLLRWRIQLLAPPNVAAAAEKYANATEKLRKRIHELGGWRDEIGPEWQVWQDAHLTLIEATRDELGA